MRIMKRFLGKTVKTIVMPAAVYLLFLLLCFQRFSNWNSVYTIFLQSLIPTITAYAVAYGMVCGLMDFTIGARITISALAGGLLSRSLGLAGLIIGCFGSALVMAAVTGLLNNLLKIPSLVLTMGLAMIYEILGARMAGNYGFVQAPRELTFLGSAPHIILLWVLSAVVFYFVYNRTKFSYHLQAVGSNEPVARSAGIPVETVKLKAFLYSSFFVGMSAMLSICQSGSVGAQTSLGSITVIFKPMISIMLALVIQNICDLTAGIFVSQLILTIFFIGLIAMGMPDTSQNVVLGFFLLVVMIVFNNLDRIRGLRRHKRTGRVKT